MTMVHFDTRTQGVDAKLQKPVDPKLLVATNSKGPATRRNRPSKAEQHPVSAKVLRLITPIRCFGLTPYSLLSTSLLPQRSLSQPLELEVVGGKRARRTRSSTQPDQDKGADSI